MWDTKFRLTIEYKKYVSLADAHGWLPECGIKLMAFVQDAQGNLLFHFSWFFETFFELKKHMLAWFKDTDVVKHTVKLSGMLW